MDNIKQICIELANLAKRQHYFCEDSWYSCPKAEGGCANDAEGDECTCGADAHNAKVNELLAAALAAPEPEEPTDEEILQLSVDCDVTYSLAEGEFCTPWQDGYNMRKEVISFAHAILARWGK